MLVPIAIQHPLWEGIHLQALLTNHPPIETVYLTDAIRAIQCLTNCVTAVGKAPTWKLPVQPSYISNTPTL